MSIFDNFPEICERKKSTFSPLTFEIHKPVFEGKVYFKTNSGAFEKCLMRIIDEKILLFKVFFQYFKFFLITLGKNYAKLSRPKRYI